MKKFKVLEDFLENYNIELSEKQEQQFYRYFEVLIETNKSMNLTAITGFDEVGEKHFLDSIAPVAFLDFKKYENLIDIGTGAGFPGLPLKILFPHLNVVLADSLNKRISFLNSLIRELELTDVYAVHGRAEELARKSDYRGKFDMCVSRAVSKLSSLSELCIPLVKTGGVFIPYKSGEITEELEKSEKAILLFGGKLKEVEEMTIGNAKLHRCFPVIEKIKNTPDIYPRKNGVPQKKPIEK